MIWKCIALLSICFVAHSEEFVRTKSAQYQKSPARSAISRVESAVSSMSRAYKSYDQGRAKNYVRNFDKQYANYQRYIEKLKTQDPGWDVSNYQRLVEIYSLRRNDAAKAQYQADAAKLRTALAKKSVKPSPGVGKSALPTVSICDSIAVKDRKRKDYSESIYNFATAIMSSPWLLRLYCVAPTDKFVQQAALIYIQKRMNASGESSELAWLQERLKTDGEKACSSSAGVPLSVRAAACFSFGKNFELGAWLWDGTPRLRSPIRKLAVASQMLGNRTASPSTYAVTRYLFAEQAMKGLTWKSVANQLEKKWGITPLSTDRKKEALYVSILAEFELINRNLELWSRASRQWGFTTKLRAIGKRAREEWTKSSKAPVFKTLFAYEAAYFGKQDRELAGCQKVLDRAWQQYLGGKNPKNASQLDAAISHPLGARLLMNRAFCATANGQRELAKGYIAILNRSANYSHFSPNYYASQRMLEAAAKGDINISGQGMSRDTTKVNLSTPYSSLEAKDLFGFAVDSNYTSMVKQPGIGSKKKAGDEVTLKFPTKRYQIFVPYDCKETRRISRIRPDGTIEYRRNCKSRKEWAKRKFPPAKVLGSGNCSLKKGEQPITGPTRLGASLLYGVVRKNRTTCVAGAKVNIAEDIFPNAYAP